MKKITLIALGISLIGNLYAQQLKLPAGKKFQLVTEVKGTSTTSMMGQDIEMVNTSVVYVDHELKSVDAKKFVLGLLIKRITGSVSGMGQEQSFDSNDESFKSNPGFGEAFKSIGKETEVTVEEGKVIVNGGLAETAKIMSGNTGDANEMGRVFLLLKDSDIKVGHTWTTSTSAEGVSSESNFSVEKVTEKEVEILVNAKVKITATMNQNGMEIKQQTEGTAKSTRIYDRSTGLLMAEAAISDLKGNMEVMGQQMPLSSKQETKTTVKLL